MPLRSWRLALDFLSTRQARLSHVRRGLLDGGTLRATDQDWTHGDGPRAAGPSESLAMAVAGRAVAVADLSGPGVDILRSRLDRRPRPAFRPAS